MTGDTTAVMIGLGLIALVLPIGLIILYRANSRIEREHPSAAAPPRPAALEAEIPTQRTSVAAESATGGWTADETIRTKPVQPAR